MEQKEPTIVTAIQKFFGDPPGRKVTIPEFKQLTIQDKIELSEMLNNTPGFEHRPYTGPTTN